MTSYKYGIRRRTCRLLVTEDRNLIGLYIFKNFKCAGVKCLQNELFSFLITKFDHFSQHKGLHSVRIAGGWGLNPLPHLADPLPLVKIRLREGRVSIPPP